jgi:hypothetical protein
MAPGCKPATSTSSSVAWCRVEDGVALHAGNLRALSSRPISVVVMAPRCTPAASARTSSSVAWCRVEDGAGMHAGSPGTDVVVGGMV